MSPLYFYHHPQKLDLRDDEHAKIQKSLEGTTYSLPEVKEFVPDSEWQSGAANLLNSRGGSGSGSGSDRLAIDDQAQKAPRKIDDAANQEELDKVVKLVRAFT
jgi:hypothetical protein